MHAYVEASSQTLGRSPVITSRYGDRKLFGSSMISIWNSCKNILKIFNSFTAKGNTPTVKRKKSVT